MPAQMALNSGIRLGPYEILTSLGAGGMGEVYRAKDTRLGRDVAIKILPASISADSVAKQRFEREAKIISGLNHPHICVLHDVGRQDGVDYLVMECVEGETLSRRLEKGPLSLEQVLRYGMEIAGALDKAHRSGVVHRDLKPGNVMLTTTGAKLLDFGLAKPSCGVLSGMTMTAANSLSPVTQPGIVVGTFQYMSPEQIEGKELDARSDIFSLGAVLYEMVTGKRAFEGKSQLSVASAILESEPAPISSVKPMAPRALDHVVRKCIAKVVEERWQCAADLASELKWISESSAQTRADQFASRPARTARPWVTNALALVTLVAVVLAVLLVKFAGRPGPRDSEVARLSIPLPPKQELAADVTQAVAVAPDGKRVAYVAAESGVSHLYVRRLDQFEAVMIPDSEGAWFPFFSPNADWVAFFNQGKLKKAPADGGVPVEICEMPAFFGGTWTPRDVIVVSVPNFGLATVPASGGSLQKVPTKEAIYPQGLTWLAGGDWIALTDYFSPRRSISAVNVNTGEARVLLENAQSPSYSAGHLIYYQGGALWAVPFDPDKLAVQGSPSEIETGVTEENYMPQASAARTGVLAYAPGPAGNFARNLFVVNRQGIERKLDLPPKDYIDPAFSPDGKRIAIVIRSVQQLEVVERDGGAVTSISPTFANFAAVWTADGKNLLFDAIARGPERTFATDASRQRGFYRAAADGSSGPELIKTTPQVSHITSVGGHYAAVMVNDPVTNMDLWLLTMRPPYEMQPFKRTSAVERQGSLSPDGHWMAYESNESGRSEIYAEPVPGPGGRKQISMEGGEQPRWVRNGREIVYRNGTKMMSVPVQVQPLFQAGKPVELFDRKFDRGVAVAAYDVTADGQTFVMTRSERDNPTEIRIVIGWRASAQKPK
jgi:hypothetical protein